MTKKEIEDRFKSGEKLIMTFGIRKNFFEIGGERITQKQFSSCANLPNTRDIIASGLTKHVYTYKP